VERPDRPIVRTHRSGDHLHPFVAQAPNPAEMGLADRAETRELGRRELDRLADMNPDPAGWVEHEQRPVQEEALSHVVQVFARLLEGSWAAAETPRHRIATGKSLDRGSDLDTYFLNGSPVRDGFTSVPFFLLNASIRALVTAADSGSTPPRLNSVHL
jgi:hypothetical protein